MLYRRQFIRNAGLATLGSVFYPKRWDRMFPGEHHAIGLQLFTFFTTIDNDVQGTLQKIADVGYKEMESAFSKLSGYYGMKPKAFASLLNNMGMTWKSHHVLGAPFKLPKGYKMPLDASGKPMTIPPMRNLRDNMQELVDEVAEGGVEYLVCANTPTGTLDEIKSSVEVLNRTDEACKKAGIVFAYHNHDMEFHEVEGKIPYDILLSDATMKMELDLAWATKGGKDPVALFQQHPGRFPLWHVKDLDATHEKILPVGSGTIDFRRIFDAASVAGMKHFFVEHDMPQDAMASIRASYAYLTNVLKV